MIMREICPVTPGAWRARTAGTAIVSLCACLLFSAPIRAETKLPPVDELLRDLKFTKGDLENAKEGKIVERSVSEGSERSLSIGLALLIKAKPEEIAKLYRETQDTELVKAFKVRFTIPGAGTPADFAAVDLQPNPEKEAQRYLDAEPGSTLNLDAKEIAAFQGLKSASKDKALPVKEVEQLVRQELLARYQAYRTKGLAGIAPYQRGKNSQRSVRDELLLATKESAGLEKYVPHLHDVLLHYPAAKEKVKKDKFEESFHWFNVELFDRPTYILTHRMAMFVDYAYVNVERTYYASHDYNSMQQVVAAIPTKDGTLMIYVARVSTDQVGGFKSAAARPVARTVMSPYIKDMLEGVRKRAEKK
jgi:hypothetical protein